MAVTPTPLARLAALLVLSVAWLLLLCAPVLAHARLLESEPADGERLSRPPEQVRLQFSEPIEAEFSPLEVYNSEGARVDLDDAEVSPDDARVLVAGLEELPEGSYTVEWRVTSADGHPIDGSYGFAVTGAGGSQGVAQADAQGAGEPGAQASNRVEPEPAQQITVSIANHAVHIVGLAVVIVVVLVMALRRKT